MASLRRVTAENLNCPLCMDTFEEATLLSCGHTFCRKCLTKYDEFHPDHADMHCPLCREATPLNEKRVEGLSSNVTLNGLVGDINRISTGLHYADESKPRCDLCQPKSMSDDHQEQAIAVSFCHECEGYLCESCLSGHTRMVHVFGTHRTVSVQEVRKEKERDSNIAKSCPEHKSEQMDFYCQDCEEVVCHKCTVVKHSGREHSIKDLAEYETETRQKIDMLVMRSSVRRAKIEKHIGDIKQEEKHIRVMLTKMESEINRAYDYKIKQLDENKQALLEEVARVEAMYYGKLIDMTKTARSLAKKISVSSEMISKGKRKPLFGESRVAHNNLYRELDVVLGEEVDMMAPSRLRDLTGKTCFVPSASDVIDLGQIGAHITGWTVVNEIDLPCDDAMNGLATMSYDKVAVSYFNGGVDSFNIYSGERKLLIESDDRGTHDIAFLSDGRFVATNTRRVLKLFNADQTPTDVSFDTPSETTGLTMLDVDAQDHIFISFWDLKKIFVFSPAGGKPLRVINTERIPRQICTTSTGSIVTQKLGNITVLDEDGNIQWSVTKRKGYLHPAVNDKDQLYIACVRPSDQSLSIEHYTFGGKHVGTVLKNAKIEIPSRHWYYMTFMSPSCIAFCTPGKLYVIQKSLTRTKTLTEVISPTTYEIESEIKICKN
ncbi:E3 ubiquitin-protein ligase Midline-1-like [Lytechinus variegatus]|uniref:E3 ubiquitin-protein ligase Midline-1-like n=1 Tax=Lytechinus variegatus TaxID=7654 RepID=UPI001BB0F0B1|nr:E3 ubiquitin-protein ligase Midline-1-like [Lytechinus variegatus]